MSSSAHRAHGIRASRPRAHRVAIAFGLGACLHAGAAVAQTASSEETGPSLLPGAGTTLFPDAAQGLRGGLDGAANAATMQNPALPDGTIRSSGEASGPTAPAGDDEAPAPPPVPRFAFPKGTAKTQDRVRLPRKGAPTLPALQPYPTAVRLRGSGVPLDTPGTKVDAAPLQPPPSVAALPVPPPPSTRLRTKVLDDGYSPLGYDVGSLRLTPYVAQSFGYDSNPDQTQVGVRPSAFSRTEGGLGLLSEWSAHELRADLRGGYNDYFSDRGANRPDAIGTIDLRIDATRDLAIDAEQRFSIDTQRPGSPELNASALDRPLITSFGTTLGATQTLGRMSIGLHGLFDRVAYDNARLSDGSVVDLANENYNDYGLRLRTAYELTPAVSPFVDVLVDDRLHDASIDLNGYRRDSVGVVAQAGSTFELTRLLTGDVSAGYGDRSYQDHRLKNLDGPVVNGSLAYAMTPLTTVRLTAATAFDETTVAASAGAQSRSLTLDVAHQLWRNLTLSGSLAYLNTQYSGVPITENTLSETVKAEYHLSRSLVATATYNHQKLDSTAVGSSFDQHVALFGVRLQH